MSHWPRLPVSAVCEIVKGGVDPQRYPAELFAHYSIPALDEGDGPVIEDGDAIKSQKTVIENQVVLVSKLNPRIPRVWLVDDDQACRRICSTEFVPLKPDPARLDLAYLAFAMRFALADGQISGSTSAATKSRERAKPNDLLRLTLPLPPLAEQRRIVDLLSRAEGIVRLRHEADKKAAELIPALFLDMFGDPATNPKGWRNITIGGVLECPIRNGISPSRTGQIAGKVLTLSAITRGDFNPYAVKEAMFSTPLAESDAVDHRDFLVCRGNGNLELVGRGCFPLSDMPGVAFPDTAIAVRVSPAFINRSFLTAVWASRYVRNQIIAVAKTTNGTYKINQTSLAGIELPLPPIELQRHFSKKFEDIRDLQSQQFTATSRAQATFDALLAGAFL